MVGEDGEAYTEWSAKSSVISAACPACLLSTCFLFLDAAGILCLFRGDFLLEVSTLHEKILGSASGNHWYLNNIIIKQAYTLLLETF